MRITFETFEFCVLWKDVKDNEIGVWGNSFTESSEDPSEAEASDLFSASNYMYNLGVKSEKCANFTEIFSKRSSKRFKSKSAQILREFSPKGPV